MRPVGLTSIFYISVIETLCRRPMSPIMRIWALLATTLWFMVLSLMYSLCRMIEPCNLDITAVATCIIPNYWLMASLLVNWVHWCWWHLFISFVHCCVNFICRDMHSILISNKVFCCCVNFVRIENPHGLHELFLVRFNHRKLTKGSLIHGWICNLSLIHLNLVTLHFAIHPRVKVALSNFTYNVNSCPFPLLGKPIWWNAFYKCKSIRLPHHSRSFIDLWEL